MLWYTGEDQMIKGLILALQFLSRIPINYPVDMNELNIRRSTFFYPYTGMLLGLLASIPYYFLHSFNNDIAAFISLLVLIILTGGLHLDGLSDTADGFFSNRDKERTLEIMKDSRIGAFGVLSLIVIIFFKFILISNIGTNLPLALILSMGNSRMIVLLQIAFKKSARPGGLGDMVHNSQPKVYILSSAILYILIIILMDISYLLALVFSMLIGELISLYSYKKIGGFTGDVYGATIELTETASLLGFWGVFIWI